jgi:hypothetical protein
MSRLNATASARYVVVFLMGAWVAMYTLIGLVGTQSP